MFLGCAFCQRLEPVGHVGYPMLERPGLHSGSYAVCRLAVERLPVVNARKQSPEGLGIEILVHLLAVEHEFSVILGRFFPGRNIDWRRLLGERILD